MPISLSGVSCFLPPFTDPPVARLAGHCGREGFTLFAGNVKSLGHLVGGQWGHSRRLRRKRRECWGRMSIVLLAGSVSPLPPSLPLSRSLARHPALPLLLRRIKEQEEGGTRKSEGDAVADAATAFEVKGPRMEGTGRKRRLSQHTYTLCFLRLISSFYCNFLGLIRIIFNPILYAWRLFLATTTHII